MVDANAVVRNQDEMLPARVGMVSFLNMAPIRCLWRERVRVPGWSMREEVPAVLNRLLFGGELDLASISSHEYALHSSEYLILPGLSIAAAGAVGSVFLFSRSPLKMLDGKRVLLSSRSQTSASLTRIILGDFEGVEPIYQVGELKGDSWEAVLSIGDEALRLAAEGRYPHRYDLAEIWCRRTGLPFVFALWAVNRRFFQQSPSTVRAIHHELIRCQRVGLNDIERICRKEAPLIPMTKEACRRYLSGMDFDLDPAQQAGLTVFFELLIKRGEVPDEALPLKFI